MVGRKLRGNEGFSLIEVLVSLVILAVGLLGLALFQTTAIKGNAIASKWTVATELAQDRLERFRHVDWVTIQPSVPGGFVPGTQPLQSAYGSLGGAVGDNTTRPWHAVLQGMAGQQQCDRFAQNHHRVVLLERRCGEMAQHYAGDPTIEYRWDLI